MLSNEKFHCKVITLSKITILDIESSIFDVTAYIKRGNSDYNSA